LILPAIHLSKSPTTRWRNAAFLFRVQRLLNSATTRCRNPLGSKLGNHNTFTIKNLGKNQIMISREQLLQEAKTSYYKPEINAELHKQLEVL
jgi:hypothetical protein